MGGGGELSVERTGLHVRSRLLSGGEEQCLQNKGCGRG